MRPSPLNSKPIQCCKCKKTKAAKLFAKEWRLRPQYGAFKEGICQVCTKVFNPWGRKSRRRPSAAKYARDAWKQGQVQAFRKNPTPTELLVLIDMKRLGFIHQYLLCGYIPDFAHLAGKLVIELDGNTHDPKADAYRDEVLRSRGWTTARFKNHEVWRNTQSFLTQVQALLQANMKETGFTRKLVGPQAQVPARSLN